MPYTLCQLEALESRELLTLAEHDLDEFTTSDTERALIYHLNDLLHVNDDFLDPDDADAVLSEVSAQLPEDDFLGHAIDIAQSIADGKMLKKGLQAEGQRLANLLEAIQDEQRNATDYANHEILKLTQPTAANVTQ
jgi:hypothetical protein